MAPHSRFQPGREEPAPGSERGKLLSLPLARLDDTALLAQLIEGRPAAFRELFERFHGLVRGQLARMLGNDSDVDDLTQEALLIVVRRCSTLRDPTALRSFVFSVAVRTARNALRKRALRQWLPWNDDSSQRAITPPHDPVLAEAVRRIYAGLDRLAPELRIAFVLRFVEGHELTEAASLSGTSLATFKRRLARAVDRFELIASRDPVLARWLEEQVQR